MNLDQVEATVMRRDVMQMESDQHRAERIYKIADQFCQPGGKCDPYDKDNFLEALSESHRAWAVRDLLRSGDEAEAGHVLKMLVEDYWHEKSLDAAERELDRRNERARQDWLVEQMAARNDY